MGPAASPRGAGGGERLQSCSLLRISVPPQLRVNTSWEHLPHGTGSPQLRGAQGRVRPRGARSWEVPGGAELSRGMLRTGGDGASGAAGAASQGGAEGAGWGFLSKLVTRRPLARGMPARTRARDFGAGTPEAGEAKLGGLPAPIPQQGCPAPRSALFFKRSHLPQVFPDPPPPTERLQSLERSQRWRCAPGPAPSSPVSGAGSRPQPRRGTLPAHPGRPAPASAREWQTANGGVPCRDLPAPLPAYRAIAS